MTVTELIEKLRSYPQDAEVVVENTDNYINGFYIATEVEDFDHNTVLISSNHDEVLDI
jgi:hypothetical protein